MSRIANNHVFPNRYLLLCRKSRHRHRLRRRHLYISHPSGVAARAASGGTKSRGTKSQSNHPSKHLVPFRSFIRPSIRLVWHCRSWSEWKDDGGTRTRWTAIAMDHWRLYWLCRGYRAIDQCWPGLKTPSSVEQVYANITIFSRHENLHSVKPEEFSNKNK